MNRPRATACKHGVTATWMLHTVVLAGTVASGCVESDDENLSEVQSSVTVATYVTSSCSTSTVLGLSRQIADEVGCALPEGLQRLTLGGNLQSTGNAVLPYLSAKGKAALEAVAADRVVQINSAFRTVAQQYLLSEWDRMNRCGIPIAASPGTSNHESGRALDLANYSVLIGAMGAKGWAHDVPGDPVHFDHLSSPDIRGQDVAAFQRLWNRNHPEDPIEVDGDYGTNTAQRIRMSPAEGFEKGADCGGARGMEVVSVDAPDRVGPQIRFKVTMKFRNSGVLEWPKTTHLHLLTGATTKLHDPSWESTEVITTLAAPVPPGGTGMMEFYVTTPMTDVEVPIFEEMTFDDAGNKFGDVQLAFTVVPGLGEGESGEGSEIPENDIEGGCSTSGGSGSGLAFLLLGLVGITGRVRRRRAA
jgi:MYXO-CTERM domain-containing protein